MEVSAFVDTSTHRTPGIIPYAVNRAYTTQISPVVTRILRESRMTFPMMLKMRLSKNIFGPLKVFAFWDFREKREKSSVLENPIKINHCFIRGII